MSLFNHLKMFTSASETLKNLVFTNSCRLISNNKRSNDSALKMYTSEQQLQIINTLHKCVADNITRTHLKEKRLQSLRLMFKQYPNMTSLEPLLKINGLGPSSLHRLCDSILQDSNKDSLVEELNDRNQKLRMPSSLLTPSEVTQSGVTQVVGIHLGVNAISWARLQTTTAELDTWEVKDISLLADKKHDVHSVWDLVTELRLEIPDGDVYVMENSNWSNVANLKKPIKYHIQDAMLTTALCAAFNLTDCSLQPRSNVTNRMYFLRAYTPARLFRKIIGSERVCAQDIVQNMIDGISDDWHYPVTFIDSTADQYRALNGAMRDNMCQVLLLVISFRELILLRNPAALSVIGRSNNAKTLDKKI